jgi:hypothetical protein
MRGHHLNSWKFYNQGDWQVARELYEYAVVPCASQCQGSHKGHKAQGGLENGENSLPSWFHSSIIPLGSLSLRRIIPRRSS